MAVKYSYVYIELDAVSICMILKPPLYRTRAKKAMLLIKKPFFQFMISYG